MATNLEQPPVEAVVVSDLVALADSLAARLTVALCDLPDGFLSSFAFTKTGNNLTHPIVWGLLARAVWEMPGVFYVGIDVRLNLGQRVKFQPDLVAFGSTPADSRHFDNHVLYVDYESPNSSDARIPKKDIDAYRAWSRGRGRDVPYLIVTTLPNRECPAWELPWPTKEMRSDNLSTHRAKIRANPFLYWYAHYEQAFTDRDLSNVALINIDGTVAQRAYPRTPQ